MTGKDLDKKLCACAQISCWWPF